MRKSTNKWNDNDVPNKSKPLGKSKMWRKFIDFYGSLSECVTKIWAIFFNRPDERLSGLNLFCKRKAFLWFYHVCMLIGRIEYTMKPNQFNGCWYLKWNENIKIENLRAWNWRKAAQKKNNNKNQTTLVHTYTIIHSHPNSLVWMGNCDICFIQLDRGECCSSNTQSSR